MDIFVGGLSGICEVLVTHPLDVIKIKMQVKQNVQVKNLYNGIFPRLLGCIPMRIVFWSSQHRIEKWLQKRHIQTSYNFLFVSTGASFCQTVLDNPIENLKIKQIQNETSSSINKSILFRAFPQTFKRNLLYLTTFKFLNEKVQHKNNTELISYTMITSGTASVVSHPYDFVKTLKQVQHSKFAKFKKFKDLFIFYHFSRNGQWKILFSGSLFRMSMGIISMTIGNFLYTKLTNT
jgi:hypothetical protein